MLIRDRVRDNRENMISNWGSYGFCSTSQVQWGQIDFDRLAWKTKRISVVGKVQYVEVLNPISKFFSDEFDNPLDPKIADNFLKICESVFDKRLLDFLEDDDIYIENNGAISLELHKQDLKTFISVGTETCGFYIKKNNEILLKENSVNLFSIDANYKLESLQVELVKLYLNPIIAKLYHRINSQPSIIVDEF